MQNKTNSIEAEGVVWFSKAIWYYSRGESDRLQWDCRDAFDMKAYIAEASGFMQVIAWIEYKMIAYS